MLALILATKGDDTDIGETTTTLVVVPPALLSQWKSETRKIAGDHLRTQVFDTETLEFQNAFEGQSAGGNAFGPSTYSITR